MGDRSSTESEPRINDAGLSILCNPTDAIADIVFVHGLQGHPRKTWACKKVPDARTSTRLSRTGLRQLLFRKHDKSLDSNKDDISEIYWPLDFLPLDCERARIITWGYDSKVTHLFGGAANQGNIFTHSRNLMHALKVCRQDFPQRKIIFVAHSFGGIIVKDIVRRAAGDDDPSLVQLYTSIEAIFFLSTPHRGSDKADMAEILRRIVSASGFDTTNRNLRTLNLNSTELESIHELFMKIYEQPNRRFQVLTFQEAKGVIGVNYLKLNERIVEPFSSSLTTTEPIQTINANHMSMCRFHSRNDEGYQQIMGELRHLIIKVQTLIGEELSGKKMETLRRENSTSSRYSFTEIERKCIALLVEHTANAAEYRSSLPHRVSGTCEWILSNSQYLEWTCREDASLLQIIGYPGSGKTTLSAYLLEHLGARGSAKNPQSTLCYFFCDEKVATQKDGCSILKSLIHQLLMRSRKSIRHIKSTYDIQGPEFCQNFGELWRLFLTVARDQNVGFVNVVIDAIDECEPITRDRLLKEISTFVSNAEWISESKPRIKFLITSRPLGTRDVIPNLPQIDLSPTNLDQDIQKVISVRVEEISRQSKCSLELVDYLKTSLDKKADRTFLWVTLILDLLEQSLLGSERDFKSIINQIPQTLAETYRRFLSAIPENHQKLAWLLLHFLIASSRPLSLGELQILAAIDRRHRTIDAMKEEFHPNIQRTLAGVLGSLVRVWDSKVYLVHLSLKEYLLETSTGTNETLVATSGFDLHKAHLLLAEKCISYLLLDDFDKDLFTMGYISHSSSSSSILTQSSDSAELSSDLFEIGATFFDEPMFLDAGVSEVITGVYPLFDYASRHWAEHLSLTGTLASLELQESVNNLLVVSNNHGQNWIQYYWIVGKQVVDFPRDSVPLITAAYFGLLPMLASSLQKPFNFQEGIGSQALYWAARRGHLDAVDWLLCTGGNTGLEIRDKQNALLVAVQNNDVDMVQRLLREERLNVDAGHDLVNFTGIQGHTPLSMAVGSGFVEITQLLLNDPRIDPGKSGFDGWTPLFWSVCRDQLAITQLLVKDNPSGLNHIDTVGRTAFSWATAYGDLQTVEYLMGFHELNTNLKDHMGRTAFSWAAGEGRLETVLYLVRSKRVDISAKDNDGRNALSWACSGSHSSVVKYLVRHDEHGINEADLDGWTPLFWTLFTKAPETVKALLESGLVDLNKKDNNGKDSLMFAEGYGYTEIAEMLREAGAGRGTSEDVED